MTKAAGSLGATQLIAYISDGESAASVRALMSRQNVRDFAVEPGGVLEATEYLKAHASPYVLIVEIPSAEDAPRLLDGLADAVNPATRVIVTGPVDTFSFYHWLMGLGIHDYLLQPFNEQQLASALAKGGAGAAPATDKAAGVQKTIALIGARGGVGTTTLATALATILATEQHAVTALIDADAQFGSVALGLDLEPSRGLRDALEKPDRIDTLFLERVMMKPSPNLSILSAEEPLSELMAPHESAGELLFAALREKFTMIVVDLPRTMTPMARYVLGSADHIIIVAEPSILSLRDALRLKDVIVDNFKRPAPTVIVNRVGLAAKQEPPKAEFTKHLGLTPAAYIPYVPEVIGVTGRGDNLVANAKLSGLVAPLRTFATQLTSKEEPGKKKEATAKQGKLGGLLKGRK